MTDLVERLRDHALYNKQDRCLMFKEAAARIEVLEAAARFLLDRLDEYEPDADDDGTDFRGHVVPARARLRAAIAPEQDK